MKQKWVLVVSVALLLCHQLATAQEAQIIVHADHVGHGLSRYLTGACIEDVSREIYGGLYGQMIFGEGFQELSPVMAPNGCAAYGGRWRVGDGVPWADGGDGRVEA